MKSRQVDVVVVGAGIVGISCAYYLAKSDRGLRVEIVDPLPPMSLTSAASGENYRNWWPHPVMTAFTDYSIDLMEAVSHASDDRLRMTRRGYALATRDAHPDALLRQLHEGYGERAAGQIRLHDGASRDVYRPATSAEWRHAPNGVDILQGRALLDRHFPGYDRSVATVVHVRRAGDISGQQLGAFMLERLRARGATVTRGRVAGIARSRSFVLSVAADEGSTALAADMVVNAAGPHVGNVAALLGEELPVRTVFQQKIAFEDVQGVIDRRMPFSIDLDRQVIDWTEQERALLAEDPGSAWLIGEMPGSIHCRPEGGDHGKWLKLGWAFNTTPSAPLADPPLDPNFPEIVLRGASRLNPGLKAYYGRFPSRLAHYGGYYTMTRENWPLIGPMRTSGAFVAGALSGFGTMAACATGALCAGWVLGERLPDFARALSPARYGDEALMRRLRASESTGLL